MFEYTKTNLLLEYTINIIYLCLSLSISLSILISIFFDRRVKYTKN